MCQVEEKPGHVTAGIWWLVNSDGFPITEKTWERMWDYVLLTHPDGKAVAEEIRDKTTQRVLYFT